MRTGAGLSSPVVAEEPACNRAARLPQAFQAGMGANNPELRVAPPRTPAVVAVLLPLLPPLRDLLVDPLSPPTMLRI